MIKLKEKHLTRLAEMGTRDPPESFIADMKVGPYRIR